MSKTRNKYTVHYTIKGTITPIGVGDLKMSFCTPYLLRAVLFSIMHGLGKIERIRF